MKKRDKSKWHRRIFCEKCKGYRTYGGSKFWFIKITEWRNECRCFQYKGETVLDKEKCEQVLKQQEKNENDN
jgi:hypothetical protein